MLAQKHQSSSATHDFHLDPGVLGRDLQKQMILSGLVVVRKGNPAVVYYFWTAAFAAGFDSRGRSKLVLGQLFARLEASFPRGK
jgi:hypothetical protein